MVQVHLGPPRLNSLGSVKVRGCFVFDPQVDPQWLRVISAVSYIQIVSLQFVRGVPMWVIHNGDAHDAELKVRLYG